LPPIAKKRKLPKQNSEVLKRADKLKRVVEGSNISFLSFRKEAKTPVLEEKI
jgi:hypothetical protein